ncbi:MAG: sodium:solute symporter [Bacteroidales bacterium]
MTENLSLIYFGVYTLFLFFIAWITSRKATNSTYFVGNRKSPWYLVAYGMIGTSLSGVTFISVPGWVGSSGFSYMMVVFGYIFGYLTIIGVLLPLYYRMKLTSIYTYLEKRFGFWTYKTGAFFFLLSRFIGAAFRMFIVVEVLQLFVFGQYDLPFVAVVTLFILLILLYSIKGGIRTIVFTDTLQTTFMLLAVFLSIYYIKQGLGLEWSGLANVVSSSSYSDMIVSDWGHNQHFLKQFFSGMFIAIVMTGLDQDMMQKNLSCKSLKDAQKNMFALSMVLVVVNFIFLVLGVLLYYYAEQSGIQIPSKTDHIFPLIALESLGPIAAAVFVIGLVSAAYSSADSAITALTTSFCIDMLDMEKWKRSDLYKQRSRMLVHLGISTFLIALMVLFKEINNEAVISSIFTVAGYTYGPLLGFFAFGLFCNYKINDKIIPYIAILAPILSYIIKWYSSNYLQYNFGFELLILNGAITYLFMFVFRNKSRKIYHLENHEEF